MLLDFRNYETFNIFLSMCLLVSSCSKKDDTTPDQNQLTITSFSPMEASIGDEIIFLGENIDLSTEYSIFFNGVVATTVQNFPTELRAIVPQGASTGNITIRYGETILDVGSLTILEWPELIITSFSPMEAFIGDEVTFIGENIDPEITYIVSFNGVTGETTNVSETEIVAIVPLGATSGEVVISYEDKNLTVGTIEIVDEADKLFGYFFPDGCSLMKINNLDINTGELLEEVAQLYAGSCEEYVKSRFYRASNFFIYTYYEHTVQGMPPQKHGLIKDFNSDVVYNWGLGRDPDIQEEILAPHDNRIYYSYRNQIDVDEAYEIRSANLNKRDIQTVYEFPFGYTYDFRNSGFLPSTNELVFFTKDESDQPIFMKLNVETSILTSTNISDTYSKIFITKTERIFGIKSLAGGVHEIVELDQGSGNLLSSLATISAKEVKNIDYSLSSNKIFALLQDKNRPWDQYLYKLNLSDGTTTTTTRLDEQNNHANFHGIYLND